MKDSLWTDCLGRAFFYHAKEGSDAFAVAKQEGMQSFNGKHGFGDIDKSLRSKFPFLSANPLEAKKLRDAISGKEYEYEVVSVLEKSKDVVLRSFPVKYKTWKLASKALDGMRAYHSKGSKDLEPILRIRILIKE